MSSPFSTRLTCLFWLLARSRTRRFIFWNVLRMGTIRNDMAFRCRSEEILANWRRWRGRSPLRSWASTGCSTTIDWAITSSPTKSIKASSFWVSILTKLLSPSAVTFGFGLGSGSGFGVGLGFGLGFGPGDLASGSLLGAAAVVTVAAAGASGISGIASLGSSD